MKQSILPIVICILSFSFQTIEGAYRGITWADIQTLEVRVRALIKNAVPPAGEGGQFLLAMMVRLGFHDCVGGCDGCINLNNADNNGLAIPMEELESLYTSLDPHKPPFWQPSTNQLAYIFQRTQTPVSVTMESCPVQIFGLFLTP